MCWIPIGIQKKPSVGTTAPPNSSNPIRGKGNLRGRPRSRLTANLGSWSAHSVLQSTCAAPPTHRADITASQARAPSSRDMSRLLTACSALREVRVTVKRFLGSAHLNCCTDDDPAAKIKVGEGRLPTTGLLLSGAQPPLSSDSEPSGNCRKWLAAPLKASW